MSARQTHCSSVALLECALHPCSTSYYCCCCPACCTARLHPAPTPVHLLSPLLSLCCLVWSAVVVLSDEYDWNLGLHEFVICFSPDDFPCQTYSLNNNDMFNDQATVASHCYTAGSGVIAAGTFAMLFALLAMAALHTYTTFKRVCGCACPVPRLFVALFSLLSLGLYIGVVTIWWIKCENNISDLAWVTDVRGGGTGRQSPSGLKPGYALIVAILCTVFALLGWVFATLRSFVAHGDDDGNTTGKSYGGSSGSTSPAHGNGSYGQQVYSPSTEGQYNGGSKQDTYGY